jgi:hypothetical protein
MSVEIAWKQNILVTDFHLLKSLLVVLGFGSQAFVCGFSRQNINSVGKFVGILGIFTYKKELPLNCIGKIAYHWYLQGLHVELVC